MSRMTPEQRRDLYLLWSTFSHAQKLSIEEIYREHYGCGQTEEHWKEYLVDRLNI